MPKIEQSSTGFKKGTTTLAVTNNLIYSKTESHPITAYIMSGKDNIKHFDELVANFPKSIDPKLKCETASGETKLANEMFTKVSQLWQVIQGDHGYGEQHSILTLAVWYGNKNLVEHMLDNLKKYGFNENDELNRALSIAKNKSVQSNAPDTSEEILHMILKRCPAAVQEKYGSPEESKESGSKPKPKG